MPQWRDGEPSSRHAGCAPHVTRARHTRTCVAHVGTGAGTSRWLASTTTGARSVVTLASGACCATLALFGRTVQADDSQSEH